MDFGFTNSDEQYKNVCKFRDDAVADGWSIEPSYAPEESVDRAAKLEKDGFHMQVISRADRGHWKYEAIIHIWCPKGIAIHHEAVYSMAQIVAGTRKCHRCKATDVDTERVGFADRVCQKCLAPARKEIETPGWCD